MQQYLEKKRKKEFTKNENFLCYLHASRVLPPSFSFYSQKKNKKKEKEKEKGKKKELMWENSHMLVITYHNLG